MKITDKFQNGVPKLAVIWIISMFLIQMATILTIYWLHSQRMLFGHLSSEQIIHESAWWVASIFITSFIESMIMIIGAITIAVKSRKWSN